MVNLLLTTSIFGIELNWGENETMTFLFIAQTVLFVVTVVTIVSLIFYTRKKGNKVDSETVVTVATQDQSYVEKPNNESSDMIVKEIDENKSIAVDNTNIIVALEGANVDESENGVTVYATDGTEIYYVYNKSFAARLIQANDEIREYYNDIKNFVLSYPKVKAKMSWKQERFSYGKEEVCWFVLRGKSLYLYLPLNPDDYAETKYKVERNNAKRYKELPCLYKINNARRAKYATDLISTVMDKFGVERAEKPLENFIGDFPYSNTITLIKDGLIKVTETDRTFFGK